MSARRWLWLALLAGAAGAQQVSLEAQAEPVRCRVGETVTYTVTALVDGAATGLEDSPPAFGGFEVAGDPQRSERPDPPGKRITWVYKLVARQAGRHELAPFELAYTAAGKAATARSKPVAVTVEAATGPRDIRPAKPLVEVPDATAPYRLLLFFLVGASTLALATAAGAWAIRRVRARPAPEPPPEPTPPVHERALAELTALAGERLPELGRIDEYHVRLSSIVRDYLAERYAIGAAESTTSEIAESLFDQGVAGETIGRCRELLYGCDLEKFAAAVPTLDEMHGLLARARTLIELTAQKLYRREPGR